MLDAAGSATAAAIPADYILDKFDGILGKLNDLKLEENTDETFDEKSLRPAGDF
jgi:hypothetical protein